jgi:hypothetical protein
VLGLSTLEVVFVEEIGYWDDFVVESNRLLFSFDFDFEVKKFISRGFRPWIMSLKSGVLKIIIGSKWCLLVLKNSAGHLRENKTLLPTFLSVIM